MHNVPVRPPYPTPALCPRSLDPIQIVTYYIRWVKTSWTDLVCHRRTQDDDDPFIKGEFDVIKELLEKIPEAKDGKKKVPKDD